MAHQFISGSNSAGHRNIGNYPVEQDRRSIELRFGPMLGTDTRRFAGIERIEPEPTDSFGRRPTPCLGFRFQSLPRDGESN
jgi:hypothetical protein